MKIIKNHSLEEYNKKYGRCKFSLLKYTQEDISKFNKEKGTILTKDKKIYNKVSLLENRNWWLIDGTYYEVPKTLSCTWFKRFSKCTRVTVCLVLGLGVIAAVTVPGYMHYKKYCTGYKIASKDVLQSVDYKYRVDYAGNLKIDVYPSDDYKYQIYGMEAIYIGENRLIPDCDYSVTTKVEKLTKSIKITNQISIFSNVIEAYKGTILVKPNLYEYVHVSSMRFLTDEITMSVGKNREIPGVELLPLNATYKQYTYKILDEEVAKIQNNQIAGVATGKTMFVATSIDNSTISAICNVEVK